ncbi:MAG: hypothetical protein CMP26_13185 [Roseibacillus sp.]|nr:hypothetical protein [Roseibacillus sp.]HAO95656.1 hypothetical protein [Verrucomicrobiales bacterium]|tara:strand:- start:1951 stop:2337 length:387 start_codon:yes stop_codon:yes gene_type:complete
MHGLTFILAVVLLILGVTGLPDTTSAAEIQTRASPGLFFGGSILIASLYAFRERRHGMAAASFLTFIAFLTSVPPILKPVYRGTYDWLLIDHRQPTIIALASALYLGIAFAAWKRARRSLAIARLRED